MSDLDDHDPMKWTKEAQAELDAAVASTPAGHPDAAKLKGGSDTPRTDVLDRIHHLKITSSSNDPRELLSEAYQDMKDNAERLERELTVANAQIDELDHRLKKCAQAGGQLAASQFVKLREANAQIVALRGALELATTSIQEWCNAVDEDASWDGWDSHFKDCKWDILPKLQQALSSPAPAVVPQRKCIRCWGTGSVEIQSGPYEMTCDNCAGTGLRHPVMHCECGELRTHGHECKHPAKGGADEK